MRTLIGFAADAACTMAKASCAVVLALSALAGSAAMAFAEDRTLKLHFTHTGERAAITYKRDGRFDQKGLAQVNRLLRDWRKNQSTRMDPRLLDLVWEVYQRSGANDYIHVVSAYRSPATNSMLRGRSRSSGVAQKSQHTLGKAMDFYIPGVKISTLRQLAMQMQVGGVGFYPTSGSPFVHLDVGNVRAWPRMSRKELARIFPNGKTMHLPADGRALPGYDQAVADYKRRVGSQSIQIASTAADDEDDSGSAKRGGSGLLTAMLPTPKSRAAEALAEQTSPKVITSAAGRKIDPEFADLAALSAPLPILRPAKAVDVDPVQTASLAPTQILAPVLAARPMPAAAPAGTRAFSALASLSAPDGMKLLRTPEGSIATLPITGPDLDVEDEFDGEDTLLSWALAAPGSDVGMAAPVIVGRTLTDLTAEASRATPLPLSIAEEFDHDRFWSGG
ncbi:DUF882 domain-containing protein [Aliirhizobium smilacinae]|uniref:Murein endopeptidase K n=1 Tax=Aliirhizobium smilacinae TaxID=1395944 RepID=A0A5C4XU18_9HYPH|nr:DUF882 domain-containing protein [Rhizobium smilacinae]